MFSFRRDYDLQVHYFAFFCYSNVHPSMHLLAAYRPLYFAFVSALPESYQLSSTSFLSHSWSVVFCFFRFFCSLTHSISYSNIIVIILMRLIHFAFLKIVIACKTNGWNIVCCTKREKHIWRSEIGIPKSFRLINIYFRLKCRL